MRIRSGHPLKDSRQRRASRGFVLITVLWMSGLLAAFAISVTTSIRSHALYARNAMSSELAEGIADGLVRLTALQLATGDGGIPADGSWRACSWGNAARAWVAVQDQSGLVDLNTASVPLMTALLEGLGLGREQAARMTSDMRDYRDADGAADLGGSEPAVYPGRSFGPKNAPFEALEELDQIPDMTPGLLLALRQFTTVANLQAGIDFGTAPAGLLRALGVSRSSVAGLAFSSPRASPDRAIVAAVELTDGTRFVRRAMIERLDQPGQPFAVLSWDEGSWGEAPERQPDDGEPCAGLRDSPPTRTDQAAPAAGGRTYG